MDEDIAMHLSKRFGQNVAFVGNSEEGFPTFDIGEFTPNTKKYGMCFFDETGTVIFTCYAEKNPMEELKKVAKYYFDLHTFSKL